MYCLGLHVNWWNVAPARLFRRAWRMLLELEITSEPPSRPTTHVIVSSGGLLRICRDVFAKTSLRTHAMSWHQEASMRYRSQRAYSDVLAAPCNIRDAILVPARTYTMTAI